MFRPIIIVTIAAGGRAVQGPAMVDSGADNTLVPAEVLAMLGIEFTELPGASRSGGAGGGFDTRPSMGEVLYEQWSVCEGFRVAEPGKLDMVLLGRADFFMKFVVRFHMYKEPPVFDLDPVARR